MLPQAINAAARYAEGEQVSQREYILISKAAQKNDVVDKLVKAREDNADIRWTEWIEIKHAIYV